VRVCGARRRGGVGCPHVAIGGSLCPSWPGGFPHGDLREAARPMADCGMQHRDRDVAVTDPGLFSLRSSLGLCLGLVRFDPLAFTLRGRR
jgi:hypothetical protein